MDRKKIERAVKMILEAIGEEPSREGLKRTPQRVAEMYEEVLDGYSKTPAKELKIHYEKENYEEIVLYLFLAKLMWLICLIKIELPG